MAWKCQWFVARSPKHSQALPSPAKPLRGTAGQGEAWQGMAKHWAAVHMTRLTELSSLSITQ